MERGSVAYEDAALLCRSRESLGTDAETWDPMADEANSQSNWVAAGSTLVLQNTVQVVENAGRDRILSRTWERLQMGLGRRTFFWKETRC